MSTEYVYVCRRLFWRAVCLRSIISLLIHMLSKNMMQFAICSFSYFHVILFGFSFFFFFVFFSSFLIDASISNICHFYLTSAVSILIFFAGSSLSLSRTHILSLSLSYEILVLYKFSFYSTMQKLWYFLIINCEFFY